MSKKIKVFVLSDHPFSPSGVGIQTKYMIEGLLKTGRFSFYCFAGAMKHPDFRPIKTEQWGDDLVIQPVEGYGKPEMVRAALRSERPDIVWIMTDPRFWVWLWEIENEIRPLCPIVYYHVWDNYPPPLFNKKYYESNDIVCTISKVTDDIVSKVAPDLKRIRVPHTVDTNIFKKASPEAVEKTRNAAFPEGQRNKMLFFWNSRNARRKQSGTLIFWFKEFLDKIGHDKATLIMHTDPKDPHGQDLVAILESLGLTDGQVLLSASKLPPEELASIYSMADCTICISDAEGFGLSTLESLACETPIIVNMTGGPQEQVTDGDKWFGIGIEPCSRAIIGSQDIPYIYEDRLNKESFLGALDEFYRASEEQRTEWGTGGRKHVMNNYSFENYVKQWDKTLTEAHEEFGSWDTRKNHNSWELKEVA